MGRRVVLLFVVLCAAGCGERWRTNTPVTVQLADPDVTFEATLDLVRARGYHVVELDQARRFLRVRSRVDNDVRVGAFYQISVRTSFLSFQVRADGSLT